MENQDLLRNRIVNNEIQKNQDILALSMGGDGNAGTLAQILVSLNGLTNTVNGLTNTVNGSRNTVNRLTNTVNGLTNTVNGLSNTLNTGFNSLIINANHKIYTENARVMFIGNDASQFPPVGRFMLYSDYNAMNVDQIAELLNFYGIRIPRNIANNAAQLLDRLSLHLSVIPISLR